MQDEAAVVKEANPLQSARFNTYTKAGIDPVEAFALLSSTDASNYFDMVLACGLRSGTESKVAAELFVKEMWYSVSRVPPPASIPKHSLPAVCTHHPCGSMDAKVSPTGSALLGCEKGCSQSVCSP